MIKRSLYLALSFISVLLLTFVDIRRGFLFPQDFYPYKSSFFMLSPFHLLFILIGYIGLKKTAGTLKNLPDENMKKLLTGILLLIILDFIIYRGTAMGRTLDAGTISMSWLDAFGESGALKTFYLSLSYLLTVWHATFLSCLLGGWGALSLPYLTKKLAVSSNNRAGLLGTLYSFTQPLCACCAAVTSPSLFNTSLPKSFGISVLIGAPLLNLSTLSLAGILLPWPFAVIRIMGGLIITLIIGMTLGHALRQNTEGSCTSPGLLDQEPSQVQDPVSRWLKLSFKIGIFLFPSIIAGVILTSFMWQFWPAGFSNSWISVAIVSVLGSIVMISTWSEIPLALQMLGQGYTGPAAAALIALPAVNLGSLLLIGKSSGQWKLAFWMGFFIMIVSFIIGICFI